VPKNSNGETGEYPVQPGFCGVFFPRRNENARFCPSAEDPRPQRGVGEAGAGGSPAPGFPFPGGIRCPELWGKLPQISGSSSCPSSSRGTGEEGSKAPILQGELFLSLYCFFCCCFLFYYYYFPLIVAPSFSSPLCHKRGKTGWKWAFPGGGKEG